MDEMRTATGWLIGFSRLLPNWKLRNDSAPFSAGEYRQTERANALISRGRMDRLYKRIERNSGVERD